jgi:hypothetical protein
MIDYTSILQTGMPRMLSFYLAAAVAAAPAVAPEYCRPANSTVAATGGASIQPAVACAIVSRSAQLRCWQRQISSTCRHSVVACRCMRLGLRQMGRATARPHSGSGQHAGAQVLHTMPASVAAGYQNRHAAARQLEVTGQNTAAQLHKQLQ